MSKPVYFKWNLKGIGAKTTMSHILLVFVVIFFASILTYIQVTRNLEDTFKQSLLVSARNLCQREESFPEIAYNKERMDAYGELFDATVVYFQPDQEGIRYTPSADVEYDFSYIITGYGVEYRWELVLDGLDKYFFACILSGEEVAETGTFNFVRGEVAFAGAPIRNAEGDVAAGVMLMKPMDSFNKQVSATFQTLLRVFLISLPLAVIIAGLLSRKLTGPILQTTEGARKLAEGQYGEYIEASGCDEVRELANVMNVLSQRLKHSIGNLRQERDKLELLVNGIDEGIIAADWYMRTLHCNQVFLEMLELDAAPEIVGIDCFYGEMMHRVMKTGVRETGKYQTSDGRKLMAIVSPLHSEEKVIIGAECLVRDVSEAERLEQMRKDYVANISHELRTPLTGIRGMVEPLIDGVFDTEAEKQDCYQIIYKETIRLEKLIREMLDMSRLQDGRMTIETEEMEVNFILEEAAARVRKTAAEAGVDLQVQAREKLICQGNEDRILQVLTIFLDNALSFTPAGGSVTIFGRREEKRVVLGVRDTGCGIQPKDLPYIWERFYKVDKSRMRTTGTGLGLAIAKLIVERMHGEIGVNSEPGKGSEFWLALETGE